MPETIQYWAPLAGDDRSAAAVSTTRSERPAASRQRWRQEPSATISSALRSAILRSLSESEAQ